MLNYHIIEKLSTQLYIFFHRSREPNELNIKSHHNQGVKCNVVKSIL